MNILFIDYVLNPFLFSVYWSAKCSLLCTDYIWRAGLSVRLSSHISYSWSRDSKGKWNTNFIYLTLCLLVSSADNLCKQFGPRSGPTKCRAWSGSKLFDILKCIPERFFPKSWFEKNQQTTKKNAILPRRQRVTGKTMWKHLFWQNDSNN